MHSCAQQKLFWEGSLHFGVKGFSAPSTGPSPGWRPIGRKVVVWGPPAAFPKRMLVGRLLHAAWRMSPWRPRRGLPSICALVFVCFRDPSAVESPQVLSRRCGLEKQLLLSSSVGCTSDLLNPTLALLAECRGSAGPCVTWRDGAAQVWADHKPRLAF